MTFQIQNGLDDVVIEDRNTGATIDSTERESPGLLLAGSSPPLHPTDIAVRFMRKKDNPWPKKDSS
ncbi:MAG: hypothetical protein ACE5G2_04540 [Candidatus Krumholzibacteriia bacterium]